MGLDVCHAFDAESLRKEAESGIGSRSDRRHKLEEEHELARDHLGSTSNAVILRVPSPRKKKDPLLTFQTMHLGKCH